MHPQHASCTQTEEALMTSETAVLDEEARMAAPSEGGSGDGRLLG